MIISRLQSPFPEFLKFVVLRQILSLIIEALCWCSMLVMIGVETKVYIREFRWFVRFGVIYSLVGDAVMVNLILSAKKFYNRFWLCWFSSRCYLFLLLSFCVVIYFAAVEMFYFLWIKYTRERYSRLHLVSAVYRIRTWVRSLFRFVSYFFSSGVGCYSSFYHNIMYGLLILGLGWWLAQPCRWIFPLLEVLYSVKAVKWNLRPW